MIAKPKAHLINWYVVVGFILGAACGALAMAALNIAFLTGGM